MSGKEHFSHIWRSKTAVRSAPAEVMGRTPMIRPQIAAVLFMIAILVGGALDVSAEQQSLRALGSNLMANATQDLAEAFMKENPDARIVVSGGGTEIGYKRWMDKSVEIVMATREMTTEEEKLATSKGLAPVKKVIAWGCVTIIVHPNNPVKELSMDQVMGIFSGKFTSWSAVGGAQKSISVHIPDAAKHGTNLFFKDKVLHGAAYATDSKIEPDWATLIRHVSMDESAVGFCLLNKTLEAGERINAPAIKKDNESAAVLPTWKTAEDGTYPINRALYFVWDGNSVTPLIRKFVDYCAQKGLHPR
jgi:phosphate transport system substrate-binding protein